ncbi:MAG: peptide chain release factor 2 [Candidatus Magasanikbacteria bacterium]|nr:peptide chain release factor 2 [Candidatus Magasanikbacteria bacterium]
MLEADKQLQTLHEEIIEARKLLDHDRKAVDVKALEIEMADTEFWKNPENAARVSKKHDELVRELELWTKLQTEVEQLIALAEMPEAEHDLDLRAEIETRGAELAEEYKKLEFYLLYSEPYDESSIIMAIHAGTGGTEAMDWAAMLQRMYLRYFEKKGWRVNIVDYSPGMEAGLKSVVMEVNGRYAYGNLKGEHGTHRLVRMSPFNADGLRQTSFALVEILPQIEQDSDLVIDPKDVRIDTMTAGGNGGQSVNTTYSAIRLVHIPTGIIVSVQNERSQLQNKETAFKILKARLLALQLQAQKKEREELRGEHKSAEWGNQIRSYVLAPYRMVKDLRTRHETSDTDGVLDGDLDPFVEAYLRWIKIKGNEARATSDDPDYEDE